MENHSLEEATKKEENIPTSVKEEMEIVDKPQEGSVANQVQNLTNKIEEIQDQEPVGKEITNEPEKNQVPEEQEKPKPNHPRPESEEDQIFPSAKRFKSGAKRSVEPFPNQVEVSMIHFDKHSPPAQVGQEREKQRLSMNKPVNSPFKGSALKDNSSKGKMRFSVNVPEVTSFDSKKETEIEQKIQEEEKDKEEKTKEEKAKEVSGESDKKAEVKEEKVEEDYQRALKKSRKSFGGKEKEESQKKEKKSPEKEIKTEEEKREESEKSDIKQPSSTKKTYKIVMEDSVSKRKAGRDSSIKGKENVRPKKEKAEEEAEERNEKGKKKGQEDHEEEEEKPRGRRTSRKKTKSKSKGKKIDEDDSDFLKSAKKNTVVRKHKSKTPAKRTTSKNRD